MTRAMAMATVLAMLCLQGARGLAEEWISSNRTVAAPKEARNKTVPAASKAPKPVVKSKIIESAAEVELENGTGDIDAEGELEREARGTKHRKARKTTDAKETSRRSRLKRREIGKISNQTFGGNTHEYTPRKRVERRRIELLRTEEMNPYIGREDREGSLETNRRSIDQA